MCIKINTNYSYITIENLHLKGAIWEGIYFQYGDHVIIKDSIISATGHNGIMLNDASNITIQNMEIYNVTISHGIYGRAVTANAIHDILIEDCYIHNFAATGITFATTDPGTLSNIIIRYNKLFHSVDTWNTGSLSPGGGGGNGIQISGNISDVDIYYNLISLSDNEGSINWGIENQSDNQNVYNNVIYGDYIRGLEVEGDGINVKNNIIYIDASYKEIISVVSGSSNIVISNNRYYNVAGSNPVAFEWKGTAYNYTDFSSWETASGDSNSSTGDPLFVDPANDDFHLQSGSLCINAGVNVGLTHDYEGNSVPQGGGVDIGALEYQGETGFQSFNYKSTNIIFEICLFLAIAILGSMAYLRRR